MDSVLILHLNINTTTVEEVVNLLQKDFLNLAVAIPILLLGLMRCISSRKINSFDIRVPDGSCS